MLRGLILMGAVMLDGCGQPSLPRQTERPSVVSLNPCTDAILAEVADRDQVLAISHYSHDPRASSMTLAAARRYPSTRGSVEEVVALRPDIVIGSTFTDPATAAALQRLGLRLERIGVASSVASSKEQIRQIAALVGHPARGVALIGRINTALAAAALPVGDARIPALLWQAGGIVPGNDALIVELMERAGLANHAAAQGLGQADYLSLEQLLAVPPRALLVTGQAGVSDGREDLLRHHPVLRQLDETKQFALDDRLLFCGGPTIIAASERLAEIRHLLARGQGAGR